MNTSNSRVSGGQNGPSPMPLSALSMEALVVPNMPLYRRIEEQERELELMALALSASQDREHVLVGVTERLQVLVSSKTAKIDELENETQRLTETLSTQNAHIQQLSAQVRALREELEAAYTTANWQRNLCSPQSS